MKVLDDEAMVCMDCLMYIANGEEPVDNPDGWSAKDVHASERAYGKGAHFVIGDSEKDDEFSRRSCDACGTQLAGSRHHAVVLGPGTNPKKKKVVRTHDKVGSWIIVEKKTGKAVTEIFNQALLKKLNTKKYKAVPAQEYLGKMSKNPAPALWQFTDSLDIKRKGFLEKAGDDGRVYYFREKGTGKLHVVSGSVLKEAKRIGWVTMDELDKEMAKWHSRSNPPMSIPQKHQMKIAKKTLSMTPQQALVMGGMSYEEAYKTVFKTDLRPRLRKLIKEYGEHPANLSWELAAYGWKTPSSLLKELIKVENPPKGKSMRYWYAAKLKSGGAIVFDSDRDYSKGSISELRKRYTWITKPFHTASEASAVLMKKVKFKNNAPTPITVVHKGKIDVQHISDPETFKKRMQLLGAKKKAQKAKKPATRKAKRNPVKAKRKRRQAVMEKIEAAKRKKNPAWWKEDDGKIRAEQVKTNINGRLVMQYDFRPWGGDLQPVLYRAGSAMVAWVSEDGVKYKGNRRTGVVSKLKGKKNPPRNKIRGKEFEYIKDRMFKVLDTYPGIREEYKSKGLSDRRFRWDVFWATKIKIGDGRGVSGDITLPGVHDTHLDTAFRRVMDQYYNKKNPPELRYPSWWKRGSKHIPQGGLIRARAAWLRLRFPDHWDKGVKKIDAEVAKKILRDYKIAIPKKAKNPPEKWHHDQLKDALNQFQLTSKSKMPKKQKEKKLEYWDGRVDAESKAVAWHNRRKNPPKQSPKGMLEKELMKAIDHVDNAKKYKSSKKDREVFKTYWEGRRDLSKEILHQAYGILNNPPEKFSKKQLNELRKAYAGIERVSLDNAGVLQEKIYAMDPVLVRQLANAKPRVKWLTMLAKNRIAFGDLAKKKKKNPPKKADTLYKAKIATKTIYVWKDPYYEKAHGKPGYAYSILGGGWRVGTLVSDRWTPELLRDKAVKEAKQRHPRSRLTVLIDEIGKSNPPKFKDERTYETYSSWRQAVKKYYPSAKFRGNKDIGAAMVDIGGKTNQEIAEWDGAYGIVFMNVNPPSRMGRRMRKRGRGRKVGHTKQLRRVKRRGGVRRVKKAKVRVEAKYPLWTERKAKTAVRRAKKAVRRLRKRSPIADAVKKDSGLRKIKRVRKVGRPKVTGRALAVTKGQGKKVGLTRKVLPRTRGRGVYQKRVDLTKRLAIGRKSQVWGPGMKLNPAQRRSIKMELEHKDLKGTVKESHGPMSHDQATKALPELKKLYKAMGYKIKYARVH